MTWPIIFHDLDSPSHSRIFYHVLYESCFNRYLSSVQLWILIGKMFIKMIKGLLDYFLWSNVVLNSPILYKKCNTLLMLLMPIFTNEVIVVTASLIIHHILTSHLNGVSPNVLIPPTIPSYQTNHKICHYR